MTIHYHDKKFRPVSNTSNGEVSDDMVFHYQQKDQVLSCQYHGKNIVHGHLLGKVNEGGEIEMRYHQVNSKGELMTGICYSTPQIMPNGKIRLYEKWRWTSGDLSEGESVLEEI